MAGSFAVFALVAAAAPAQDHQHRATNPARVTTVAQSSGATPFENVSREPQTVEVTLVAAPTRLSLIPGPATGVYAYNGSVPGPTLEVREGDRVIIHFRNNLPEPTTIHWHGLHIPFDQDGSPFHPVAPGAKHDYTFTLRKGSAGTYWYHPHPHHNTGAQVGRGLYGAIVVRANDDPLPTMTDRVLVISDNRFRPDNSFDFPDPASPAGRTDAENGREGPVFFVNGKVKPEIDIRAGETQRWRIINATASRVLRLAVSGHKLVHVGTDGGLFEHPVEVDEVTLGVGERAEVLVRAVAAPGARSALQMLPYDRYIPQTKPKDWDQTRELLSLKYSSKPRVQPIRIPTTLRAIPVLDTTQVAAVRVMALTQHLINGRSMDMNRVDVSARLGDTEIWQIENLVGMDHPFHLHGFQFQVLDRNGVPERDRRWKDVVNVPRHQTARFVVRYDNHPGKWMFHCHILDHEDHGMMG
ncbi:MAG: multicopper oxidase family protein, partial [Gemmatimonadaceae bacterium]